MLRSQGTQHQFSGFGEPFRERQTAGHRPHSPKPTPLGQILAIFWLIFAFGHQSRGASRGIPDLGGLEMERAATVGPDGGKQGSMGKASRTGNVLNTGNILNIGNILNMENMLRTGNTLNMGSILNMRNILNTGNALNMGNMLNM